MAERIIDGERELMRAILLELARRRPPVRRAMNSVAARSALDASAAATARRQPAA